MSTLFEIGITRDFLNASGNLVYKDIGLGLIDAEEGVTREFFPANLSPVPPEQVDLFDGVLSLTPHWRSETFARGAERLLVVARFGVGYDELDVAVLTQNDVLLTIAKGAPDHPVAGGIMAMMLALTRRLVEKDRLVRENRWTERGSYQGTEIAGKTLGIIGYGGAGRRLRQLVEPWEMRVLAFDPYVADEVLAEQNVERAASLEALFEQSDFVSVHCLLNESTRGLIHGEHFRRMKPTAYFFNAARGPIVVEQDLIEALKNGNMAGAGIDVFEREPPDPENPLLHMKNVLLAPHAVCWTDECFQTIGETAVRSLLSVAKGERPLGMINPEVWDRPGFQRKLAAMRARVAAD
jgi:phosphoglycerate dehydrogenase-like enzyme